MTEMTGRCNTTVGKAVEVPVGRRMTILTGLGGSNMSGMFTGGGGAVMAGFTIPGDPRMVEIGDQPAIHRMTGIALGVGLQMAGVLTGRPYPVVTA